MLERFLFSLYFSLLLPTSFTGTLAKKPEPSDIIRLFSQKESEFRDVWQQYTYTQRIVFQVLGLSNQVKEQREMIVEVFFTSEGRRETKVVSDVGQLRSIRVSKEDISDATSMQPFVLTTEELPEYKVKYKGKETVDELETFIFDVKPRKIRKNKRYFEGRIWVDDVDFQIVMSRGKIVPDYRDNKFPEFETVREQIDGEYWFPTWTEGDDILTFGGFGNRRDVHIRLLITYGDFQRFEVGTSIKYGSPDPSEDP
jgi:hypothetical protein